MLKIETIQFNRYKGIDGNKQTIISEEIATLKLLKTLDIQKQHITAYNKKNHINIKGFSSNYHNFNMDKTNYSNAELLFKEILDANNIKYIHELKIGVSDTLNKKHFYHLDFYIPSIKLCVEISPLFHFTYQTVCIRDKLRTSLLKRKHNIKTIVVKVHFRTKKGITETYLNATDTQKAITEIKKKLKQKPHKETLNRYI